MMKRLLTEDYQQIIEKAISLPQGDYYSYYLNIVEENYKANQDIIQQMKKIINRLIGWYKKETLDYDLGYDEAGELVINDTDETIIPMQLKTWKIWVDVDFAFFNSHIEIVESIQAAIDLKSELRSIENNLPELFRQSLPPMPEGFEIKDLKERLNLLQLIPEVIEIINDEIQKPQLKDNLLIFDNTILAELYQKCNDVMFEDVKYPEFEDWFRVEPIGKPTIKDKKETEFCGILGTIEEKKSELVSNFAKWVKNIGINGYSVKKKRAANYKRKEQIK
ncbi:MAG: hypothetical protein AB7U05_09505 [Mangrovibacterium sp.]